jgi:hypothetical protein
MYFPTLDAATGRLARFVVTPTRLRRLQVTRAVDADAQWLLDTLNGEGRRLGTRAVPQPDGTFRLEWA